MSTTVTRFRNQSLALLASAVLLAACADNEPLAPEPAPAAPEIVLETDARFDPRVAFAVAAMQVATARYHNLNAAIADGFVLLHPCEERPGEGPVGIVYVNMERLVDGRIDPKKPEALIYEPRRRGLPRLVGVEFALPYTLWDRPEPPKFLGNEFQREDEFGVWALHAWVWSLNPEGLFAESNPRVSCTAG